MKTIFLLLLACLTAHAQTPWSFTFGMRPLASTTVAALDTTVP
jgi:hypothetical protein